MVLYMWLALAFATTVVFLSNQIGKIFTARLAFFWYSTKYRLTFKDLPSKFTGSNKITITPSSTSKNKKRKLRLVFIRHGQSMWNSIFNSYGLGWPQRAIRAVFMELWCFFLKPFDSALLDSPLSTKGKKEAGELANFLKGSPNVISQDPSTSVIVASNLRRAMETALIGLKSRVTETRECIVVDSSLQEGSSNIDAQSFSTEPGKMAPMLIGDIKDSKQLVNYFNPYLNAGNKKIGEDVYHRMDHFVHHLFDGASALSLKPAKGNRSNYELEEVIVVGHSGYFRNFFRRFLPASSTHIAKQKKMQNCAVVAFTLEFDASTGIISVDESSITTLFKGFM